MNPDYGDAYTGFATDNTRPTHDDHQPQSVGQETEGEQRRDSKEPELEMTDAEDSDGSRTFEGEESDSDDTTPIRSRHDHRALWVQRPGSNGPIWMKW